MYELNNKLLFLTKKFIILIKKKKKKRNIGQNKTDTKLKFRYINENIACVRSHQRKARSKLKVNNIVF